MDTEQSSEIIEGSDSPQQETLIEKEAVNKVESPADFEPPATTNGDHEQVNDHSEIENGIGTEEKEMEDPKMVENTPKEDPEMEPASSPSDKDEKIADVDKAADANLPEQEDKPVEMSEDESIPETATAQEQEATEPPKEEKVVGNVEVQSANDVAAGDAVKAVEPEKKEEDKMAAGALTTDEKMENDKPADQLKEKSDTSEAVVTAQSMAEETKPEVQEQEEDPTPATGSLAFAILDLDQTKEMLKTTRTLVVLRGLPGSGKSFLARAIVEVYKEHSVVLSAEDHGVKPESPDGYKEFDDAIVAKCSQSESPVMVVVDDTNHAQDRLAHLKRIAKQHQLGAIFLEPRTEWNRDVAQLMKKTKRGLEQAKMEAMMRLHEEMSLPLYFGWFLFSNVQDKVRELSLNFLKTLATLDNFKKYLSDFGEKEGEEVDLEKYFKAKGTLHCTTKFTNYGKAEGAKEYAEKKVVQDLYGAVSDLSLSALFITPRTVGTRVSLTDDQLQLWPEDAEKEAAVSVPGAETLPLGSRAHITLGCADQVQPVQTGYDLLQILLLQKGGQQDVVVEELDSGTLTYYGEGRWYLALKEPISACACFSSSYKAKAPGAVKKEKKKQKCTIL